MPSMAILFIRFSTSDERAHFYRRCVSEELRATTFIFWRISARWPGRLFIPPRSHPTRHRFSLLMIIADNFVSAFY